MPSKYGGIEVAEAPERTATARSKYGGREPREDKLTRMGVPAGMSLEQFLESTGEATVSEFPLEPGESRAAEELPELMEVGVGEMMPEETGVGKGLGVTAAALTMTDPNEIAEMLSQFPNIGIQWAPDGTVIAANNETGVKVVINRPGMSAMDVMQGLGIAAAFTPAGRLASLPGAVVPRIAVGAVAAGGTEDIIQRGQEAAGGDYSAVDVALSTVLGPLAELGAPIVKGFTASKEFLGSFVGKGMDRLLPEAKAAAMAFAREAKGTLASAREAIITTGDALGEALTPARLEFLKRAERMPVTGTGPIKIRQKGERVELIEDIARQYDVDPNTSYGKAVLDDLVKTRKANLDIGLNARKAAEKTLNPKGVVNIESAAKEIDDIVAAELEKGTLANMALVKRLGRMKLDLIGGARDFGGLRKYRSQVWKGVPRDELYSGDINAALKGVGRAITKDMDAFASRHSDEALGQWKEYNRIFRDDLTNVKEGQLGKLLKSAATVLDQDLIDRVLQSNKPKFLAQLYGRLDQPGKKAMKAKLLQDVLTEAGWPNPKQLDPNKLVKILDSKKYREKIATFFPGDAGKQISGLKEYLRLTAKSQTAGQDIGMAAAQSMTFAEQLRRITGVTGILARIHESAPVRNLLLRLHHAQGNQRLTDSIMEQLRGPIIAAGRQVMGADDPSNAGIRRSNAIGSMLSSLDRFRSLGDHNSTAPKLVEAFETGSMESRITMAGMAPTADPDKRARVADRLMGSSTFNKAMNIAAEGRVKEAETMLKRLPAWQAFRNDLGAGTRAEMTSMGPIAWLTEQPEPPPAPPAPEEAMLPADQTSPEAMPPVAPPPEVVAGVQ